MSSKRPVLVTEAQLESIALGVLTEFSRCELLMDANNLLITRVKTPMMARASSLTNGRIKPCVQSVVQVSYFAKHGNYALVLIGYLAGDSDNQETTDKANRRILLASIREHWGLLRKRAAS